MLFDVCYDVTNATQNAWCATSLYSVTQLNNLIKSDKMTPTHFTPVIQVVNTNVFTDLQSLESFRKDAQLCVSSDTQQINQDLSGIKIKHIRDLKTQLTYTTYNNEPREIIIYQIESASIPAQNALLKTLEEPPANTKIVLVTANLEEILPTIRSRCHIQVIPSEAEGSLNTKSPNTQYSTPHTLSEAILIAEANKDRQAALQLISQLIEQTHTNPNYPSPQLVKTLKELTKTKDLLKKNVNVRLALESCFFKLI